MDVRELMSDFQLVGTSVRRMEFNNDFVAINPDREEIARAIRVEYEINSIDMQEIEERIQGVITLFIDVKISDIEEELEMELHNVIEGCFGLSVPKNTDFSAEETAETFKELLSVNGCAALYSISRGFIASITSQACLNGGITLPMINTFKLVDGQNESGDE
jgi:hypothetical protein